MSLFGKKKSLSISSDVSINTNRKSKEYGDISKLDKKVKEEENSIHESYAKLGEVYYKYHGENCFEEKLLPICNVIKESKRVIQSCQNQILFIQGIKICPSCGKRLTLDSVYCNKCGTKTDDYDSNTDTSVSSKLTIVKCRECGSDNTSDTIFCTNCGAKIN